MLSPPGSCLPPVGFWGGLAYASLHPHACLLALCSQKGEQSLEGLWLDLHLSFMQSLVSAGAAWVLGPESQRLYYLCDGLCANQQGQERPPGQTRETLWSDIWISL